METFIAPREFVDNPEYSRQRQRQLATLDLATVDAPLRYLIAGFATLPYCFTLQCCYGHFLTASSDDRHNLKPLPRSSSPARVENRIAYVALCIERSLAGKRLRDEFAAVPAIDPEYVQFGSATWFWDRQVNSYALQVEPRRFRTRDVVQVDATEALRLQDTRDRFFNNLNRLLSGLVAGDESG